MKNAVKFLRPLGISLILPGLAWSMVLSGPVAAQAQPRPVTERTLTLAQASQADLTALRSHLQTQNWQAADAETRRILQTYIYPDGDIYAAPLADNIPADVLRAIDQLWAEASGGQFGLGAQQAIWQAVSAQYPNSPEAAAKAFGDRVGWTRPDEDDSYQFVSPDWLTESELTYSTAAPKGHLPWVGIDWAQVQQILSTQGCGSCAIDALYLQGERFTRYLPLLFNRVAATLNNSTPSTNAWSQVSLARSIGLRSLYPNSACPLSTLDSAISSNGKVIAISSYSYERACSSDNNSTLALWNAQQGTRLITLVRGQATESFSYQGTAQEPETEGTRIVGDVANAIAFTPDSRHVIAGLSNGKIKLWTTDKGEPVATLAGHRYAVRAIALSADGQTLASVSSDNTLKLWNLQTGQLLRTLSLNPANGIVRTLLISPNGQRLAIATSRNALQLWNAQTGQIVRTFVDETTNWPTAIPIAFSPDSQRLATADIDNSVKLWDANTGARFITLEGHTEAVKHLAFSPDSQRLASSSEKTARLWNLQTYQTAHTFDLVETAGHSYRPDNLGDVDFNPDGRVLAVNTLLLPGAPLPGQSEPLIPAQGVTLFDVETGQPLNQIHGVAQFQFSPDGQFLIARGQAVQLWQPDSPTAAQ